MVLEKIFFYCKSMGDNDPRDRAPEVWLAGFLKKITIHCYTQNMKALGLVVSEKNIFICFSHHALRVGPVWTPGARLAGFIKRTLIYSYTQNIKALGPVVSEIF